MASIVEVLITSLQDFTVSRQMMVAAVTIMLYDWLLSFKEEVRLLWPARWSTVKCVYLVNRYFLPFNIIFAVYGWSGTANFFTPLACKIWISTDSFVLLSFFASLHYIVSLRAWALWGRQKYLGFLIWGLFIAYLLTTYTITGKAMISIPAQRIPLINICFGQLPSYLWSIWLPSILYESFIFILTAVKAYQHSRLNIENPILSVLYRDGFLYFMFIALNSFTNLIWWATAPSTRVLHIKYFTAAICQVAGSHLILDLLSVGHRSGNSILSSNNSKRNIHRGVILKRPDHSDAAFEMQISPTNGLDSIQQHYTADWKVAASPDSETVVGSPLNGDRTVQFRYPPEPHPNRLKNKNLQWGDDDQYSRPG